MNQRQITGKILQKNDLKLSDIAFLICRGCWPIAVGLPEEAAFEQAFDYYDAVTKEDVTNVDGVKSLILRNNYFVLQKIVHYFALTFHLTLQTPSLKPWLIMQDSTISEVLAT